MCTYGTRGILGEIRDTYIIENIDEYDNVLAEISAMFRNNDAMYICGYFNTAFDREHSWHTQSLKQLMSQYNLICGVGFIQLRVDYSYCNSSNNSYSVIDHFVMSLFCGIVDEIDNYIINQIMH